MSQCCKTKINIPLVYEVPNQSTMKSEILHLLTVAKRGYDLKNDRVEVIQCGSTQAENHLAKAEYLCVCMLSSLPISEMPCNRSYWPLQGYRFSVPLATCACLQHNRFCLVFSRDFNIMSGLSIHQPLTVPQKIDSREGLFHCKQGLVCGCGRMNIYYNKPPFTLGFGPFLAKCGAICC